MLCQLLCLDRRYQRMNCFNVRELQALLKNRFFTELTNVNEQHEFFEQTAIGVRFKNFGLDVLNSNIFLLYRSVVNPETHGRFQLYDNILSGPGFNAKTICKTTPLGKLLNDLESLANQAAMNYFYKALLQFLASTSQHVTLACKSHSAPL